MISHEIKTLNDVLSGLKSEHTSVEIHAGCQKGVLHLHSSDMSDGTKCVVKGFLQNLIDTYQRKVDVLHEKLSEL